MADRTESGELGGGPRVQVSKPPQKGPLADSLKGMNDTVTPRTSKQGTVGGGQTSGGTNP